MPRVSPKRRAALDIVDALFFSQTYLLRLYSEGPSLKKLRDDATALTAEEAGYCQELVVLHVLVSCVNDAIQVVGVRGIEAYALKHTVYCLLEAWGPAVKPRLNSSAATREGGNPSFALTESIDPTLPAGANRSLEAALIAVLAEGTHGVDMETAVSIANDVLGGDTLPTAVRYRLAERAFSLEFMDAPAQFLSWMCRSGVLTSGKFYVEDATREISEEFKARAVLLCEFMLWRDFLARVSGAHTDRHKAIRLLQENLGASMSDGAFQQLCEECEFYIRLDRVKTRESAIPTFDLARLADEAYLHTCLDVFGRNHWRSRFWTGPQQSWIGVLGAGTMHAYHSLVNPDLRITLNGNDHSDSQYDMPLYGDQSKKRPDRDNVAGRASKHMGGYGFDILPSSLYETYLALYRHRTNGLMSRMSDYFALQHALDLVFPSGAFDPVYLLTMVAGLRGGSYDAMST